MGYVTPQLARQHLRLDDDDPTDLDHIVEAASAMVANYLKGAPVYTEYDERGTDAVPDPIKPAVEAATLLMAGYLYRYRDEDPGYTPGYLPAPVVSILYPLRDPSCA